MYLTTLFSEISCFSDFFWGRDRTGQTDILIDRLFSENDILDQIFFLQYIKQVQGQHSKK